MRFDPADGSRPTQSTVRTGTLAAPPQQNPQREGFRFDGWTRDSQPFDFQTPILQDTTLKAQWSETTDWTLSPDHGPASGTRLTISPPNRQEPYYVSIHTTGNQTIGLTGDGHIYTWTQNSTAKQIPFPAQAPDGFHYLQTTAGSRSQAALGSDQHIYTWDSQQATPGTLDTGPNIRFTSISMNNDRLLAVDQQGQVHAHKTSQADSQNKKPAEQGTTSLPGQAQAVTVAASDSQALIVDADGHAWTWNKTTENSKPKRVKQDPGTRTVQAQTLNQGFILLDADGHAWYLADNTTTMFQIGLPDRAQVSRITANKDQAIITGTDGHIWAWKPSDTPVRADKGNQQYTQAASNSGRITAISRQGGIFTWSLDAQGNPGKPARLDTIAAPALESASLDSQQLKLSKTVDAWQTEIPSRKPGQAAILITGRQNGQLFTRNLKYTVNQSLLRDTQQGSTYKVTFNAGGGNPEPRVQNISYPYGRVQRPSPDPDREGYLFDGWFINEVAYDFSKPVTESLTLTAKWTSKKPNNTWKINPNRGSQLGGQKTSITAPDTSRGIKFNQVYGSKDGNFDFSLAVGSDGNAYAWGNNKYGQLGDGTKTNKITPVMVKKPADTPEDFTYTQISAGGDYSLALGSDGYVYAWGHNNYGQLGNNTTFSSTVPVRVSDPHNPNNTGTGLKAVQVSAGSYHSLAIDIDGETWAWGYNYYGQLGNKTNSGSDNPNPVPKPVQYPESEGTVSTLQVSAGYAHSLAVDSKGNTWAWGYNYNGELGNGTSSGTYHPNPDPVKATYPKDAGQTVQVSAGYAHSLAIDSKGNTWAWGYNYKGLLGDNSQIDQHSPVPVQSTPGYTLKAVQVCAGYAHSLAIDTSGNTWAWGYNYSGLLGINNTKDVQYLVRVLNSDQSSSSAGPWLNAAQVSAGYSHSVAIGKDGSARAWGNNGAGQLGTDTKSSSSVPVSVVFNLQPVISGVRFDQTSASDLTHGQVGNSVTATVPKHEPGPVIVSVDYTMGGTGKVTTDKSLTYTYTPLGVLPQAGGEGILLALATGMTGMGGVMASRRHRREQLQLLHASHE